MRVIVEITFGSDSAPVSKAFATKLDKFKQKDALHYMMQTVIIMRINPYEVRRVCVIAAGRKRATIDGEELVRYVHKVREFHIRAIRNM